MPTSSTVTITTNTVATIDSGTAGRVLVTNIGSTNVDITHGAAYVCGDRIEGIGPGESHWLQPVGFQPITATGIVTVTNGAISGTGSGQLQVVAYSMGERVA
jgi:hypothetical protein